MERLDRLDKGFPARNIVTLASTVTLGNLLRTNREISSMTSQRRTLIQSGAARAALGACLITSFLALSVESGRTQVLPSWNQECKKLFRQYKKKPRHKAFAVSDANSSSMTQSCGSAWSAPSKAAAEAAAKRWCREGGGSRCVIKESEEESGAPRALHGEAQ
jgi:hypothetical protein